MTFKLSAVVLALSAAGVAHAAPVVIDNTHLTYTQNFDTLASSATAANTTTTAWANDSTLAGWSLFGKDSTVLPATYIANAGGANTGSFYSFGGTSGAALTDRALGSAASGGTYFGSPASGSVAGYIAVALTNNTGRTLSSFTLNYDGEQWRNGGNSTTQSLTLQYGFGTSFSAVTSWTAAGAAFNFSSVVNTTTAGTVDGNAAANRVAGLGGTVSTSWADGQTLWVRWVDLNDLGNDHGLAIDNLSFSAPAAAVVTDVPEPTSGAIALAGLGVAGLLARRRRAI